MFSGYPIIRQQKLRSVRRQLSAIEKAAIVEDWTVAIYKTFEVKSKVWSRRIERRINMKERRVTEIERRKK